MIPFKNGDLVYDKKYDEVFVYDEKVDKQAVSARPSDFSLAGDQE